MYLVSHLWTVQLQLKR